MGAHSFGADDGGLECANAGYLSSHVPVDSEEFVETALVSVDSNVAYAVSYYEDRGQLVSVDVADPSNMVTVGTLEDLVFRHVRTVHVADGFAFLTTHDDVVYIVDVSDPSSMFIVGSLQMPEEVAVIGVFGHYVYTWSFRAVYTIDVSSPSSPVIVNTFVTDHNCGMAIKDNFGVHIVYDGRINAVDLTDPESPSYISSVDLGIGRLSKLAIGQGSVVYALHETQLALIDYGSPELPVVLAVYDLGELLDGFVVDSLEAMNVDGGVLSLVYGDGGLFALDVSNPIEVKLAGNIVLPGEGQNQDISGGIAFVADIAPGLTAIDLGSLNLINPLVGQAGLDDLFAASTVRVIGDIAYLASEDYGILPFDISDPTQPVLLGTGYGASSHDIGSVVFHEGFAYVEREIEGLDVVDFRDPDSPVLHHTIEFDRTAEKIVQDGSLACVYIDGSEGTGFVLLDLDTSPEPTIQSVIDPLSGCVNSYALVGQNLYVAATIQTAGFPDELFELIRIDLSDPGYPMCRQTLPITEGIAFFEVGNDVIYAGGHEWIHIINRDDFSVLDSIRFSGDVDSLKAHDDRLYVGSWGHLSVFDISDEARPQYLAATVVQSGVTDIDQVDSLAFIASRDFGLEIVNASSDCGVCLADLNDDGVLSYFDVAAFLVAYMDSDPAADVNRDGMFDFRDVSAFLSAYNAGCQ